MKIYTLFSNGQKHLSNKSDLSKIKYDGTLNDIVIDVTHAQQELSKIPVDDIIHFFSTVAAKWSTSQSDIQKQYSIYGINFLIYWMREKNLRKIANESLRGNCQCLDEFSQLPNVDGVLLANPRGTICHWLAGNVPILGMLSLIQGLITKNANILKVSKQNYHVIPELLHSMSSIECKTKDGSILSGRDITKACAAIYFDSQQTELQKQLSQIADVRVAWGGQEAVNAIISIPKHFFTEDVIFGPKTSFLVIGHEALQSKKLAISFAKRAAIDASVFEQRGCNSPHTVFVETGAPITPKQFAEILSIEMNNALERYPKEPVAAGEVTKLLATRTQYDMFAEAYYPDSLEWTVVYGEKDTGLATPQFNRTLFVRPISDIYQIAQFCNHYTQSAGVALSPERKHTFAKLVSRKGIDRVPDIGTMTAHEIPWDGMFIMDRFIRWCRIN